MMDLLIIPFLAHCKAFPRVPRTTCPPAHSRAVPRERSALQSRGTIPAHGLTCQTEIIWVTSTSLSAQSQERGATRSKEKQERNRRNVGGINSPKFKHFQLLTALTLRKLKDFISHSISFLEALMRSETPSRYCTQAEPPEDRCPQKIDVGPLG